MVVKCPGCGREREWESNPYRPFCSERCQRIDLGRWASGSYSIPSEPVPDTERDDTIPNSRSDKPS